MKGICGISRIMMYLEICIIILVILHLLYIIPR